MFLCWGFGLLFCGVLVWCFELICCSVFGMLRWCCLHVGVDWCFGVWIGYWLVCLVGWIGCVGFGGLGYIVDVFCLVGCVGGWLYWFVFGFGVCSFGVYCLLLCITLCCWVFVWFV